MSDINERTPYRQNKEARIFVIETCENCKEHQWNTRHDQAKYEDFFNRGKLLDWSLLTSECLFISFECDRRENSWGAGHAQPDSQGVRKLRFVLQFNPQRGSISSVFLAGAAHWRFWSFLQRTSKFSLAINARSRQFLFIYYSWFSANLVDVIGRMWNLWPTNAWRLSRKKDKATTLRLSLPVCPLKKTAARRLREWRDARPAQWRNLRWDRTKHIKERKWFRNRSYKKCHHRCLQPRFKSSYRRKRLSWCSQLKSWYRWKSRHISLTIFRRIGHRVVTPCMKLQAANLLVKTKRMKA